MKYVCSFSNLFRGNFYTSCSRKLAHYIHPAFNLNFFSKSWQNFLLVLDLDETHFLLKSKFLFSPVSSHFRSRGTLRQEQLCIISFPNMLISLEKLPNMFKLSPCLSQFTILIFDLWPLSGCFMDKFSSYRSLGSRQKAVGLRVHAYLFLVKSNIYFTLVTI